MESINIAILQSEELLTFGKRAVAIFAEKGQVNDTFGLTPFINRATDAVTNYGKAFEREVKNPYTIELANKDAVRDNAFVAFRCYVEACSLRSADGWSAAGNKLLDIIRKHGWSAQSLGYKIETAVITSICSEIADKYNTELEFLSAKTWLGELDAAQASFEETQKRSVTREITETPGLVKLRPVLAEAIKKLFSMATLQYSVNPANADMAAYAKAIDELIVLTMSTARSFETRKENEKKKAVNSTTETK